MVVHPKTSKQISNDSEKECDSQKNNFDSIEGIADSFDFKDGTLVKMDLIHNTALNADEELDLRIEGMIEENEGRWKCKVCGKTTAHKNQSKNHAEKHIEDVSHICHICSKPFSIRQYLRQHISNVHSELFSCNVCGKTGMNRATYGMHRQRNHKTLPTKH